MGVEVAVSKRRTVSPAADQLAVALLSLAACRYSAMLSGDLSYVGVGVL